MLLSLIAESFFHMSVDNGQKELKMIFSLWLIVLEHERELLLVFLRQRTLA